MVWWWLVYWVATLVLTEVMRPKLNVEDAAAANSDEVNMPTASATKTLRVVWGKVRLRDLNLMWYGDYLAAPIRKKAGKGGFLGMGSTIWQTVGYRYHWGQHLGLGHGPLTLHRIWSEEREIWSGANTGGEIIIDDEAMYGGEDQGGGIVAGLRFFPGDENHVQDPYLTKMLGEVPGYRGVASLLWLGPSAPAVSIVTQVWEWVKASDDPAETEWIQQPHTVTLNKPSGYIGTGPTPRALTVEASRYPSQLVPAKSKIGDDANPAEVLYECLTTDPNGPDGWGMGLNVSMIDVASFIAAANKCYDEGFGISLTWGDQSAVEDVIASVCKTIDAVCFRDFRSGKWTLKLLRDDYVIGSLPVFNESNTLEVTSFSQSSIDGSVNEVKVNFTDRAGNYKARPAQAQDLANMRMQNDIVSSTMAYPAIMLPALADRVANRELLALSSSPAKIELIVNREAYAYAPGDVFSFSRESLGIANMPVRVLKSAIGLPNANQIRLSVVQDIFKLGQTAYMAGGETGWSTPVQNVAPISIQKVIELPHFLHKDKNTSGYALVAARPTNGCSALTLFQKLAADTIYNLREVDTPAFTPTGTLASQYGLTSNTDESGTLIVGNGIDLNMLSALNADDRWYGGNLFVFDTGEWCSFRSATDNGDGTFTLLGVWRGLFHTKQVTHNVGERVWFYSYGSATAADDVAQNASIDVKGLPFGPRGSISLDAAAKASATMQAITKLPYPPGDVRINGSKTILSRCVSTADLTWSNRVRSASEIVVDGDGDGAAAPEGKYTVWIYVGGSLKRSYELTQNHLTSETPGIVSHTGLVHVSGDSCALTTSNGWDIYNDPPHRMVLVNASGISSMVGGLDTQGSADGAGINATFNGICMPCRDAAGNIYVLDNRGLIRKITPSNIVTTLYDLTSMWSGVASIMGFCIDNNGDFYVMTPFREIIKIIVSTGQQVAIAGNRWTSSGYQIDGTGAAASFDSETRMVYDPVNGGMFLLGHTVVGVTDTIHIRYCTPAGVVTTLATTPGQYNCPFCAAGGALYLYSGGGGSNIAKCTSAGVVTVTPLTAADGKRAYPTELAADPNGLLFFSGVKDQTYAVVFGKIDAACRSSVIYEDPGGIGYQASQRLLDAADGSLPVVFKLRQSVTEYIDGVPHQYSSELIETQPITMTGLGMCLGNYLGGVQE